VRNCHTSFNTNRRQDVTPANVIMTQSSKIKNKNGDNISALAAH